VIAGANAIANFPYVYGGGHASFVDNAYDCSGSVSYALAAGGLLSAPETSGQLESWGAPGPGKWITVYANAGHTYMYVNIGGAWMLYDTAGRSGVYAASRRSARDGGRTIDGGGCVPASAGRAARASAGKANEGAVPDPSENLGIRSFSSPASISRDEVHLRPSSGGVEPSDYK
jgi:hypothetical protein